VVKSVKAEITLEEFMKGLRRRNPGETEFHQAVKEVMIHLIPFANQNPRYLRSSNG